MSLKKNTAANCLGSFYLTIANILVIPFYISYLGAEAYGLVGFFTLLQQWLRMFDLGLTPTLSREAARQKSDSISVEAFKNLTKSLEYFYFAIAFVVSVVMIFSSRWVAMFWLKKEAISVEIIWQSLLLMGITVPLRWVLSLYRGGLTGMEKHVWLSAFTVISATMRTFGVILVFETAGASLPVFFMYQAILAVIEVITIIVYFHSNLPDTGRAAKFSWAALRGVGLFAGSIAVTSGLWLLITQADRFVLSSTLLLSDFAVYNLAITAAFVVGLFSEPVSRVIMPRMTSLFSQNRNQEMIQLYRQATQCVVVLTTAITGTLVVYSEPVVYAWTGRQDLAAAASPILRWYALGNGILNLLAFQYYLQFACGQLKYHLRFHIAAAILWLPAVSFVAVRYGAIGTGKLWSLLQLITFVCWTWYIHQKFVPGLHGRWLKEDVLPVVFTSSAVLAGLQYLFPDFVEFSRLQCLSASAIIFTALFLTGALTSGFCREQLLMYACKRKLTNGPT